MFPLYKLYYIRGIESFAGLSENEVEAVKREYAGERLRGITSALIWASENPEVDLTDILPGLPHTNEQIHEYLRKVLKSLSHK